MSNDVILIAYQVSVYKTGATDFFGRVKGPVCVLAFANLKRDFKLYA